MNISFLCRKNVILNFNIYDYEIDVLTITVAHTILASVFELSAGVVGWAPRMPNISKHAL